MKARLDFRKASPRRREGDDGPACVRSHNCDLDHSLLELVKLRASQLNGCAHCIDMHTKELRADGESEQRLYLLNAWRASRRSTATVSAPRSSWTEAVTLVAESQVAG